ncbi:MAG: rRNA pseudouridine synthase [Hyphomicrobiaceae bacterium]|nr:rRNA pseudouridine synthase [Hyphomicrobiaceae bacterium]
MSLHPSIRADRLISNLGYGTRKDVHALALSGQIHLDGMPLKDVTRKIFLENDLPERLTIAGKKMDPLPGLVLIMNKPTGMTCSHKDTGALVYDLLPSRWRARKLKIVTVGRLDKHTSGLLLLTDNGVLTHRITAPRSKIAKRYRVVLEHPLRGDEGEIFASGRLVLTGDKTPLLPAVLEIANDKSANTFNVTKQIMSRLVAFVTIYEGRNHQVRRMFAAVGNHVVSLHRDRVGGLHLQNDMPLGTYRLLDNNCTSSIFDDTFSSHNKCTYYLSNSKAFRVFSPDTPMPIGSESG